MVTAPLQNSRPTKSMLTISLAKPQQQPPPALELPIVYPQSLEVSDGMMECQGLDPSPITPFSEACEAVRVRRWRPETTGQ